MVSNLINSSWIRTLAPRVEKPRPSYACNRGHYAQGGNQSKNKLQVLGCSQKAARKLGSDTQCIITQLVNFTTIGHF